MGGGGCLYIHHLVKKIKVFPLKVKSFRILQYIKNPGPGRGFHPPPSPLYHGAGMTLHVRLRVKMWCIASQLISYGFCFVGPAPVVQNMDSAINKSIKWIITVNSRLEDTQLLNGHNDNTDGSYIPGKNKLPTFD